MIVFHSQGWAFACGICFGFSAGIAVDVMTRKRFLDDTIKQVTALVREMLRTGEGKWR